MRGKIRRLGVAGVLAVLAVLATTAGPAAARGTTASAVQWCDPLASSSFSSLAALAPSSTARSAGTIQRERDTRGIAADTEFSGGQAVPANFSATVPIYWHVITDGTTGMVTKKQIRDQITAMNLGFSGFYGGADTGFSFRLAGVDYTDNAAWFAQNSFQDEVDMKSALKEGGPTDLNVYSTSGGGVLGWAYYPSITNSNQYEVLDGIVFHYGSVPGGYIANYNLGFTLVHEAGHWLGLAHTFEQGCIGHGDYVDDTPAEATPTSGCPVGKDTCSEPGFDPIKNFMDYSYDTCYTQFTPGQSDRTHEQYLHWRVKHP